MYMSLKGTWKRREKTKESWEHERSGRVYGSGVQREKENGWSRADAVSMARFRSGHSLELNGYRCRIGMVPSGECRRCGEADETVEHVMECVAGARMRHELNINGLSDLCCRPREALKYWRWWRRVRLKPAE